MQRTRDKWRKRSTRKMRRRRRNRRRKIGGLGDTKEVEKKIGK